ncbi:conserved unknown protein [Ectocarpus siliculosus]|uniref:E3 UFM1-protein ligase 1-like N-terminal domain-containing protein n=1 Tax=Ectocarpus siliculosus TaxID=2880 RepID=D7G9I2_ECTSI|nr:conserved unknown protein [Ectocarpus siliculosus]|eukprot:CBJ28322.1 conserved unknown protein [Ectocarpus siliculosus]
MKGLVQATTTADGGEIVTTGRLRADIVSAINTAGGRASSHELEVATGVCQTTIGAAVREFWTEQLHGRWFQCEEGLQVFTSAYLSSLALEAGTAAAERGRVSLKELAPILKLPVEFTGTLVSEWMHDPGSHLMTARKLKLVSGALVTEAYEKTKRAELCSICGAATEPRSVEELMEDCDLLHPEEEEMALELLTGLTESGELEGSLAGGARGAQAYVPDSFVAAQHEAAHAFFSANDYLDHATASGLQVRKLHAFVRDRHPDAVLLEKVVVSSAVVERLQAVADGAVAEASWFEAWAVVPTVLSDADAAHLVGMCAACKRSDGDPLKVLQLGVYGVSATFVQGIIAQFREEAASESSSTAPSGGSWGGEGHPARASASGGSSRKGGGKNRKRGGSRKPGGDVDLAAEREAERFVRRCRPELEDFARLVTALGAHVAPALREAREEVVRRANQRSSADSFHERADAFETAFETSYFDFQLRCRGVQALRNSLRQQQQQQQRSVPRHPDGGDGPPVSGKDGCESEGLAEEYLLRTLGAQLAELVTARECEKLGIPFASQDGGACRRPEERMPFISKAACSALAEVLSGDVAGSLVRLWQAATAGCQLSDFCETLEDQVFPVCNLVGRRLDKRQERLMVEDRQRETKASLFRSVSERDVFHFAALVVFQSVTGATPLLPTPGLPQPTQEGGHDSSQQQQQQQPWAGVLLDAVRGHVSSETEECLSGLQRELQASEAVATWADAGESGRGAAEDSSVGNNDGVVRVKAEKARDKDATAGLFLVASVHGFIASSCARSALRASSTRGNGFLAVGTQEAYGRVTESRNHARGVRPLSMTKPNFTKTLGTVLIVGSTIGVSAIPFLSLGPQQQALRLYALSTKTVTLPKEIPVFFLRDESGAVHVENGEGLFFMSPGDAKEKLQDLKGAEGTKVAATTLDDVWYPLIKKKGLNKNSVAAGASGLSDLSARYRIIPRSNQVAQALETQGWNAVADAGGVPVWAAETLAFRGTGNKMKLPLFTNVDDLMTSWDRLETEGGSEAKSPTIQVSSIGAIIDMMQRGGGDQRNLEFFADMDAIEQAEKLL